MYELSHFFFTADFDKAVINENIKNNFPRTEKKTWLFFI